MKWKEFKQALATLLIFCTLAGFVSVSILTSLFYYERWQYNREGRDLLNQLREQSELLGRSLNIIDRYEKLLEEESK